MQTTSSHTSVAPEETTKAPEGKAATKPRLSGLEYFYRFLIVITGIILAGIAALIISLFAGWIPVVC